MSDNRPRGGERRQRQSSSDLDVNNTPKTKRANMATTPTGGTVSASKTEFNLEHVCQLITEVKVSQDLLRASIDQRLTNIEKMFKMQLETCMKDLKDSIDLDMAKMENRIMAMEDKICSLETPAGSSTGATGNTETYMRQSDESVLIFKNLVETESETIDELKTYVQSILSSIDTHADVISLERLGKQTTSDSSDHSENQRKWERPVKVVFANREQRNAILRAKRKLKSSEHFSDVYVEPDRTRHERIIEANIRAIVKSMPTLEIRRGRVATKLE